MVSLKRWKLIQYLGARALAFNSCTQEYAHYDWGKLQINRYGPLLFGLSASAGDSSIGGSNDVLGHSIPIFSLQSCSQHLTAF
jgi:hypothetical protein